jgi:hypothetical protein
LERLCCSKPRDQEGNLLEDAVSFLIRFTVSLSFSLPLSPSFSSFPCLFLSANSPFAVQMVEEEEEGEEEPFDPKTLVSPQTHSPNHTHTHTHTHTATLLHFLALSLSRSLALSLSLRWLSLLPTTPPPPTPTHSHTRTPSPVCSRTSKKFLVRTSNSDGRSERSKRRSAETS